MIDNHHQSSRLHEFHVVVGPTSHELPVCHEVMYTATLKGADGATIEREHLALVYEGLLGDPDQVPWMVAHALRALLLNQE